MNIQHLVFNNRRRGLPEGGMKRRLSEANGGVVDMNCTEVGVGRMAISTQYSCAGAISNFRRAATRVPNRCLGCPKSIKYIRILL